MFSAFLRPARRRSISQDEHKVSCCAATGSMLRRSYAENAWIIERFFTKF
jgi:hypothetical protein